MNINTLVLSTASTTVLSVLDPRHPLVVLEGVASGCVTLTFCAPGNGDVEIDETICTQIALPNVWTPCVQEALPNVDPEFMESDDDAYGCIEDFRETRYVELMGNGDLNVDNGTMLEIVESTCGVCACLIHEVGKQVICTDCYFKQGEDCAEHCDDWQNDLFTTPIVKLTPNERAASVVFELTIDWDAKRQIASWGDDLKKAKAAQRVLDILRGVYHDIQQAGYRAKYA
jgi:hypothetical protein